MSFLIMQNQALSNFYNEVYSFLTSDLESVACPKSSLCGKPPQRKEDAQNTNLTSKARRKDDSCNNQSLAIEGWKPLRAVVLTPKPSAC